MIFAPDFFPHWLILTCSVIAAMGVGFAAFFAPWSLIYKNTERQHLVFGASILLGLFWMLKIDALEVLTFHPLVMTAVTLLLGWSFAMLAGLVAELLLLVIGFDQWTMLGVNYFVTVMVPVTLSFAVFKFSQRFFWKNLFVFFLAAGFMGGALCALAVAVVTFVLLVLGGYDLTYSDIAKDLPILLLLMFPEGFINGMLITAITVFKPHLVKTFNEDFYLKNR